MPNKCQCDHCGTSVTHEAGPFGEIVWCGQCIKENQDLLTRLGVKEQYCDGLHWISWPSSHHPYHKLKTIPKKIAPMPSMTLPPLSIAADVTTVTFAKGTEGKCHCCHGRVSISASDCSYKPDFDVALCSTCVEEHRSYLESEMVLYDRNEVKDRRWTNMGSGYTKVLSLPQKPVYGYCDHCESSITDRYHMPSATMWCADCICQDNQLLVEAKPSYLPGIYSKSVGWEQQDNVDRIKKIPKKLKTSAMTTNQTSSEANKVADCDHCGNKTVLQKDLATVAWCLDCANQDYQLLVDAKLSYTPAKTHANDLFWNAPSNVDKLRAIPKRTLITNNAPKNEARAVETVLDPNEYIHHNCHHCDQLITDQKWARRNISWCAGCTNQDRKLLEDAGVTCLPVKEANYSSSWSIDANVAKLRTIPKKKQPEQVFYNLWYPDQKRWVSLQELGSEENIHHPKKLTKEEVTKYIEKNSRNTWLEIRQIAEDGVSSIAPTSEDKKTTDEKLTKVDEFTTCVACGRSCRTYGATSDCLFTCRDCAVKVYLLKGTNTKAELQSMLDRSSGEEGTAFPKTFQAEIDHLKANTQGPTSTTVPCFWCKCPTPSNYAGFVNVCASCSPHSYASWYASYNTDKLMNDGLTIENAYQTLFKEFLDKYDGNSSHDLPHNRNLGIFLHTHPHYLARASKDMLESSKGLWEPHLLRPMVREHYERCMGQGITDTSHFRPGDRVELQVFSPFVDQGRLTKVSGTWLGTKLDTGDPLVFLDQTLATTTICSRKENIEACKKLGLDYTLPNAYCVSPFTTVITSRTAKVIAEEKPIETTKKLTWDDVKVGDTVRIAIKPQGKDQAVHEGIFVGPCGSPNKYQAVIKLNQEQDFPSHKSVTLGKSNAGGHWMAYSCYANAKALGLDVDSKTFWFDNKSHDTELLAIVKSAEDTQKKDGKPLGTVAEEVKSPETLSIPAKSEMEVISCTYCNHCGDELKNEDLPVRNYKLTHFWCKRCMEEDSHLLEAQGVHFGINVSNAGIQGWGKKSNIDGVVAVHKYNSTHKCEVCAKDTYRDLSYQSHNIHTCGPCATKIWDAKENPHNVSGYKDYTWGHDELTKNSLQAVKELFVKHRQGYGIDKAGERATQKMFDGLSYTEARTTYLPSEEPKQIPASPTTTCYSCGKTCNQFTDNKSCFHVCNDCYQQVYKFHTGGAPHNQYPDGTYLGNSWLTIIEKWKAAQIQPVTVACYGCGKAVTSQPGHEHRLHVCGECHPKVWKFHFTGEPFTLYPDGTWLTNDWKPIIEQWKATQIPEGKTACYGCGKACTKLDRTNLDTHVWNICGDCNQHIENLYWGYRGNNIDAEKTISWQYELETRREELGRGFKANGTTSCFSCGQSCTNWEAGPDYLNVCGKCLRDAHKKKGIVFKYQERDFPCHKEWLPFIEAIKADLKASAAVVEEKSINVVKPSAFRSELTKAGYRVAAHQMSKGVKSALLLALTNKGMESEKIAHLMEMLDTEVGTALISMLLGYSLTYLPALNQDARARKLVTEFRINGMSGAGNALLNTVFANFTEIAKTLPELTTPEDPKAPKKGPTADLPTQENITNA